MRFEGNWWLRTACVCAFLLAACGDKPEQKPEPKEPAVAAPATPPPASTSDDPNPKYEATLAEGIDFRKRGYPTFIAEVSGMSEHEAWGRWSDAANGPSVKFRFRQALPPKFTLELTVNAFGPNVGQPVRVRVGQVEQSFVHADAANPGTYRLAFETGAAADTVEIIPPKPTSPAEFAGTPDVRKVGIAFFALKVLN